MDYNLFQNKQFIDIIEMYQDIDTFSFDIGISYGTANSWKFRNSIPAKYWKDLIKSLEKRNIGRINGDILLQVMENSRRRRRKNIEKEVETLQGFTVF